MTTKKSSKYKLDIIVLVSSLFVCFCFVMFVCFCFDDYRKADPADSGAGADEDGENADAEEEEEAVNELTLEEYKAQRTGKRSGEAFKKLEGRKVTDSIEGKVFQKAEEEELFAPTRGKKKQKEKKQARKTIVDGLAFAVKDPNAQGRDGGRRGRHITITIILYQ